MPTPKLLNVFTWNLRVYYEDTDSAGVVYYANYLKFFERARTEWLSTFGICHTRLRTVEKILFVVCHCSIDYLAPAKLDDNLGINVMLEKIGRASLRIQQQCCRGEQVLSQGHVIIACVDATRLKSCAIPLPVLHALQGHQITAS